MNTQSVRQRFWDGQDKMLRDDVTMIKGNHLVQFGGTYERNYDYHLRNDNGQGIMNATVYQIGSGPGVTYPSQYRAGRRPDEPAQHLPDTLFRGPGHRRTSRKTCTPGAAPS